MAWLGCSSAGMVACETIQSKYVATALDATGKPIAVERDDSGLIVSGEELTELSSPLFGAVEVTFENKSRHWAHLRTTSIRFGSETLDRTIYTPVGDDLFSWQQATLARNGLRRYNTELAFVTAASVGRVTSLAAGRGNALHAAGKLVTLASLGGLLVSEASEPPLELFPYDHLLADVISVPPGLFAKRWVVFHTPEPKLSGCLCRMQLGFQLDDGRIKYVLLPFRKRYGRSEWEAEVCNSVYPDAAQSRLNCP